MRRIRGPGERGVSLVELMAVVVIIGITAAIAVVGWRRYIRSSHMAEATQLVGDIRAAQERHKQETGSYVDISVDISPTNGYPEGTNPATGVVAVQWGLPCSKVCKSGQDWANLPVHPDQPVLFGYSTVAGSGGSVTPTNHGANVQIGGTAVDWVGINGGQPISGPWYVAGAYLDYDHNGIYATVLGDSFSNTILQDNEGE
jgi:type IV pilus assembly protein PilA